MKIYEDMDKTLLKVIESKEKEVKESLDFLNYLKSLDLNEVLTEEKWHQLCKTELKNSIILEKFVQNIFPEATNIELNKDFVSFSLYKINCKIPTTNECKIIVDDYFKYANVPEIKSPYNKDTKRMIDYFEALDNHKDWKTLINLRIDKSTNLTSFNLFCRWFFNLKWKKENREDWINKKKFEESCFEDRKKFFENVQNDYKQRLIDLEEKVIPLLYGFTKNIEYTPKKEILNTDFVDWNYIDKKNEFIKKTTSSRCCFFNSFLYD